MKWLILALTDESTREFSPLDDKEYVSIKTSLQRQERYTTIQETDTRDNDRLPDMRVCVMTKAGRYIL